MKYRVVSIAVDQEGYVLLPTSHAFDADGRREEVIDTKTNRVFASCRGPWDVEDRYEAFWNRLNPEWESAFPEGKERAKVLRVERVSKSTAVGVVGEPARMESSVS